MAQTCETVEVYNVDKNELGNLFPNILKSVRLWASVGRFQSAEQRSLPTLADNNSSIEQHLLRAARRVLRPLVRILLRYGVPATALQEVVRKAYVDVAHDEFGLEGKPQTLARVSVLTGLNRKEVARLHRLPPVDEADGEWRTRAGQVLARWFVDPDFLDRKGDPLDLPFAEGSPNFSELVKKYSGDMYPRSIADELLRLGLVEETQGRLRMTFRGYVPTNDPAMVIDILGLDTAAFIETIDHNIEADNDSKLMQLRAVSYSLPASQVEDFLRESRRGGQQLIENVADWLGRHEIDEQEGKDNSIELRTIGLGVYQILGRPNMNEKKL